jgi:hypothetical protein
MRCVLSLEPCDMSRKSRAPDLQRVRRPGLFGCVQRVRDVVQYQRLRHVTKSGKTGGLKPEMTVEAEV